MFPVQQIIENHHSWIKICITILKTIVIQHVHSVHDQPELTLSFYLFFLLIYMCSHYHRNFDDTLNTENCDEYTVSMSLMGMFKC